MANAVKKVNSIAIADIKNINGITDSNLKKLNGLEFTGVTDAHTFISSATASNSSVLSFTSGIDSTYDVYEFHFINIHPANDAVDLRFQVNADGGSGYNEAMATTFFRTKHHEDGSAQEIAYIAGYDRTPADASSQPFQPLGNGTSTDATHSTSGILTLYGPSSGTYVKHFQAQLVEAHESDIIMDTYVAGYVNTTTAIDEIQFKMSAGSIATGEIRMYGLAKS